MSRYSYQHAVPFLLLGAKVRCHTRSCIGTSSFSVAIKSFIFYNFHYLYFNKDINLFFVFFFKEATFLNMNEFMKMPLRERGLQP